MAEKNKGFLSRLFGKLDSKLEEKSKEPCACCAKPRKGEREKDTDTGCCG